jgi:hypothetical protein
LLTAWWQQADFFVQINKSFCAEILFFHPSGSGHLTKSLYQSYLRYSKMVILSQKHSEKALKKQPKNYT